MVNALAPPSTTEQGLSNKMQSVEWNEQQETQQPTPYLISCLKIASHKERISVTKVSINTFQCILNKLYHPKEMMTRFNQQTSYRTSHLHRTEHNRTVISEEWILLPEIWRHVPAAQCPAGGKVCLCNGSYAMASLWWTRPGAIPGSSGRHLPGVRSVLGVVNLPLGGSCTPVNPSLHALHPCTCCVGSMVQPLTFWAMLKVNLILVGLFWVPIQATAVCLEAKAEYIQLIWRQTPGNQSVQWKANFTSIVRSTRMLA